MKDIRLYDYQEDMKQRIEASFETHQSVMVQMPTGTGNTMLLASIVKDEVRRVADEAHHAVAKTYAEVMNAYPEAKKLGVTATPCRLTKRGFTDLFEVLLCSHSIPQFIKEGYLADFDYISLSPSSEDQKKIDRLEKRAADGDYNIAEMQGVLDCRPSIEQLFQSIEEYVKGKKGIVYAINIEHAEHIAEYYREQGLEAVAISSKTPKEERRRLIELFKGGSAEDNKPSYASLSLSKTESSDKELRKLGTEEIRNSESEDFPLVW